MASTYVLHGPQGPFIVTESASKQYVFESVIVSEAPAATTVVFRKSLSDIGGRVGTRQAFGG